MPRHRKPRPTDLDEVAAHLDRLYLETLRRGTKTVIAGNVPKEVPLTPTDTAEIRRRLRDLNHQPPAAPHTARRLGAALADFEGKGPGKGFGPFPPNSDDPHWRNSDGTICQNPPGEKQEQR